MEKALLTMDYKPDRHILYCTWNASTSHAKWEEMQDTMLNYIEMIERKTPAFILVDERNLNFIWTPVYQEWVDNNISVRTANANIKKIAIIQSAEIFVAVAVTQLMDEKNSKNLNQEFFDSYEKAEKWLLS